MKTIFDIVSKNLTSKSDKDFDVLRVNFQHVDDLNENEFANLTFKMITASNVKRINTQTFGQTAQTLTLFWCLLCQIPHSPPHYDLWKAFGQLSKLTSLTINVDVDEIPENAISPPNGTKSQLQQLELRN